MFSKDSDRVYRVAELERLGWLIHGFGTRDSSCWPPAPLATVKQVHSDVLACATGPGVQGRADALLANTPGLYVAIRTADCIPILIADGKRRAVAAVHAGWRGTVAGIAVKAVNAMRERFGSEPEDLLAAIGPGICGGCYRVGPEVAEQFQRLFPERGDLEGQTTVDLREANRRQLAAAGVPTNHIYTGAPCTFCHPEEFHSHRRTPGQAGRMVAAIGIAAAAP